MSDCKVSFLGTEFSPTDSTRSTFDASDMGFSRTSNPSALAARKRFTNFKYAVDWLMALLALIMLAPTFVLIALLIGLDSRGPALFRQRRVGYSNKEFVCFKFRTMQENSHRAGDRESAITHAADTRITRIGRVLRRSRFDELPQIINILRGEMSWIGPRPEAVELSHWYESTIPNYNLRFLVRPGITGLAQVRQGHVAGIDATATKLGYDLDYVENWSLKHDAKIAIETLRILVTGYGSK